MLDDFFAVVGFVVLLAGAAVVLSMAWYAVEYAVFWAFTWRRRREACQRYAAAGWNTVADEIPDDRYVVAAFIGLEPQVCKREGDRLVNSWINLDLDSCVGWVALPLLDDGLK